MILQQQHVPTPHVGHNHPNHPHHPGGGPSTGPTPSHYKPVGNNPTKPNHPHHHKHHHHQQPRRHSAPRFPLEMVEMARVMLPLALPAAC